MLVDRLLHDLARRPALTARQRSCLALSSMYSILNGRSDETLDGHSWWLRQESWDMLSGSWSIKGHTTAAKRDRALVVLDWLGGEGDRSDPEKAALATDQDLLAWDMARLVHVARSARHARFLDEPEVWTYVLAAGARLARAFRGWDDFGHSFLRGRLAWAGDAKVEGAVERLLAEPESTWNRRAWKNLAA
jgi:Protein of unknown function (DUF1266)